MCRNKNRKGLEMVRRNILIETEGGNYVAAIMEICNNELRLAVAQSEGKPGYLESLRQIEALSMEMQEDDRMAFRENCATVGFENKVDCISMKR